MNTLLDLGQWIKTQRNKAGFTLDQLAERAGVSKTVIWDAENAKRPVTVKLLAKVTHGLGTNAIDAAEIMWSAALGERVEVPDVTDSERWVLELRPYFSTASASAKESAIHFVQVTLKNFAEQEARVARGERMQSPCG